MQKKSNQIINDFIVDNTEFFVSKTDKYNRIALPHRNYMEKSLYRFRMNLIVNPAALREMRQFITFTINPENYETFFQAPGLYIRKFFNRLSMGLKKGVKYRFKNSNTVKTFKLNKKLKYVWRLEFGSMNDRLHLHTMLNCKFIPFQYLKKVWGLGLIQSEKMDNTSTQTIDKIIAYVSAYLTVNPDKKKICKINKLPYQGPHQKLKYKPMAHKYGKSWDFPFQWISRFKPITKSEYDKIGNEPLPVITTFSKLPLRKKKRPSVLFQKLVLAKYRSIESKKMSIPTLGHEMDGGKNNTIVNKKT